MGTILSAIVDGLLKYAFQYLTSVMERRGLIAQGMATQAAKETASSAVTEAAISQAVADSPKTKDAALERLKGGSA